MRICDDCGKFTPETKTGDNGNELCEVCLLNLAAPDLLKILKEIRRDFINDECCCSDSDSTCLPCGVDKLISKAEGK